MKDEILERKKTKIRSKYASCSKEETIGYRIKNRRIKLNISQEELAELMCVPRSTISTYERDAADIKSSVVIELANVLNTTPNYLLGFGDDKITQGIASYVSSIKDNKVKEMLFVQAKALSKIM